MSINYAKYIFYYQCHVCKQNTQGRIYTVRNEWGDNIIQAPLPFNMTTATKDNKEFVFMCGCNTSTKV